MSVSEKEKEEKEEFSLIQGLFSLFFIYFFYYIILFVLFCKKKVSRESNSITKHAILDSNMIILFIINMRAHKLKVIK